jgi:hypothetical protein
MSTSPTVAEILREHVVLELDCLDRFYLNLYVPKLQRDLGVVSFFRVHRGFPVASSALMGQLTHTFVQAIERFAPEQDVALLRFEKGQRKDGVAQRFLRRFEGEEGVLFVGKAQEKASVWRTEARRDAAGARYPWITRSTALVNPYYFYCVDEDFGPFFLKFCSYFPYNAKLCVNGHEYLKRQLRKEGIAFEALDNGILSCADPVRMQEIADALGPEQIERLARKWMQRLPHPFREEDQRAGYTYELSILQAEVSLTQVLDRPQTGRILFEEIIRENLDLGRPDHVQLLFERRITRRTPGRFRTRVLRRGVSPSLHIDYKSTRMKQYHKEQRALRTETTINNPRDFSLGKRLTNLPALREIGRSANRRLLCVERLSHDCSIGDAVLPASDAAAAGGEPTRQRASLRRCSRAASAGRVARLSSAALRLFQPHLERASGSSAGPGARHDLRGAHDVRPAAAASARTHRAHSTHAPLPGHRRRATGGALLHAGLCAADPSRADAGAAAPRGAALRAAECGGAAGESDGPVL